MVFMLSDEELLLRAEEALCKALVGLTEAQAGVMWAYNELAEIRRKREHNASLEASRRQAEPRPV